MSHNYRIGQLHALQGVAFSVIVLLGLILVPGARAATDTPPSIPGAETTATPTPVPTATTDTTTTTTTTSAPATGPESVLIISAIGGGLAMTLRRIGLKRQ